MYAAMENKTALIDRMLELGCDIHAKNKVGRKRKENKKQIKRILMTIIPMKICDSPSGSPFMIASGRGNWQEGGSLNYGDPIFRK